MRSGFLFLSLALAVAGCGGETSAADYFTGLESAAMALDGELDTIEADFNAGLLDIDFEGSGAERALIGLFQASISATAGSFTSLVRSLEDLDPPDDIADSHGEALLAGRRVIEAFDERRDQLAAIDGLAGIDAYAQSLLDSGVRSRFTETCLELQAQADRVAVAVDLGC